MSNELRLVLIVVIVLAAYLWYGLFVIDNWTTILKGGKDMEASEP